MVKTKIVPMKYKTSCGLSVVVPSMLQMVQYLIDPTSSSVNCMSFDWTDSRKLTTFSKKRDNKIRVSVNVSVFNFNMKLSSF